MSQRGNPRRIVAATVAILLTAVLTAPTASAHRHHRAAPVPVDGQHISGGEVLANIFERAYLHSDAQEGTCQPVARHVIVPFGDENEIARCTTSRRTKLTVGTGASCSTAEPPPFYAATAAEQLACALEGDATVEAINVVIDGAPPVDIHKRRFELISPQRALILPPDNLSELPPGPMTFRAHGWFALISGLRRGPHTINVEVIASDYAYGFTVLLELV
jgi:hypothetical protein